MKRKTSLIFFISTLLLLGCTANSRNSKSNAIASLFENAKKESQSSSIEEASSLSSVDESSLSSSEESFADSESLSSSSSDEIESSNSEIVSSSKSAPTYESVDVDLTTMTSTMVYSQVLNMLDEPNSYIGKIVKMSGPFRPFESTNPLYCYPAILITDATACCGSGIEFLLYDVPLCSMSGGNGYPRYNEEATIVGRFETYLEGSYLYIHLVDALWLK